MNNEEKILAFIVGGGCGTGYPRQAFSNRKVAAVTICLAEFIVRKKFPD